MLASPEERKWIFIYCPVVGNPHSLFKLQETMCSLLFAQRVRAVELGTAKKTVDSTEVAALKKRIKELEVSLSLVVD